MDDRVSVEAMLGRALRSEMTVVSRCHLGLPVVVECPPLLDDGTPFPTIYYLTCPLARNRIGVLESSGLMRELDACVDVRPADAAYAAVRAERLRSTGAPPGAPAPSGGVGGAHGGVKCLHARYAYRRGGGDDPAGAAAAGRIEPLDCRVPCVGVE